MHQDTHPLWCSPARCEVAFGGAHSAEPIAINFDRHASGFCRVRLWLRPQFIDTAGIVRTPPVLVELVAGETDNGSNVRADFTVPQVRQLNAVLISTLIAAGDDDSNDTQEAMKR